jgi:hypothetical protein
MPRQSTMHFDHRASDSAMHTKLVGDGPMKVNGFGTENGLGVVMVSFMKPPVKGKL